MSDYIILSLLIICCLYSGDLHLPFDMSNKFLSVCEGVYGAIRNAVFVILLSLYDLAAVSAILLWIKSPVAPAVSWIALSEAVLSASFVAPEKKFCTIAL